MIVPIHKSGESDQAKNYRSISLLNIGYKVLTAMMAKSVSEWVEENNILRESQAGFRRGRGTRDHISTPQTLINKVMARKKGRAYVAFFDFKAAFDSVDRELMIEKPKRVGIEGRMLKMIETIYQRTNARVRVGVGNTEDFETNIRVRQWCALSAILFYIFLDEIDKEWEEMKISGIHVRNLRIHALKYADDVAVVSDDPYELRKMMKGLEKFPEENKLMVKTKKIKIMVVADSNY